MKRKRNVQTFFMARSLTLLWRIDEKRKTKKQKRTRKSEAKRKIYVIKIWLRGERKSRPKEKVLNLRRKVSRRILILDDQRGGFETSLVKLL